MSYKPSTEPGRVFDVVITFRDELKPLTVLGVLESELSSIVATIGVDGARVSLWTDTATLVAFPADRIRDITATIQEATHG